MLFDVHCHINSLSNEELESLLLNCKNCCFIDSSIDYQSSLNSDNLSRTYTFIYSSVGFHPFSAEKYYNSLLLEYKKLILGNKKIVAIGEIGLDFKAIDIADLKKQEEIFQKFLLLAKELGLAVIIHNRTKDNRIFEILDEIYNSYEKVVFHCFSYDNKMMDTIVKKGGFVSFSLNILRKNEMIIEALRNCPVSNLLFETDSPYIRIDDNKPLPSDIEKVYQLAKSIKNIEQEKLEEAIASNVKKIFNIEKI